MSKWIGMRRPSPAMVVATVALFTALGGVAGAALVGQGGVVRACVSKDGAIKVVDESTGACSGTQTLVSLAGVDGAGKVANADRLDGKDASDFLQAGPAGGDLTGTYPNPGIGAGKVTSAHVLDGALTAADLADDAVAADEIADGAVTTAAFAPNSTAPNADAVGGLKKRDLIAFFKPFVAPADNHDGTWSLIGRGLVIGSTWGSDRSGVFGTVDGDGRFEYRLDCPTRGGPSGMTVSANGYFDPVQAHIFFYC